MKDVLRSVRGTADWMPGQFARRRAIESELRRAVELFGYREAETPILEHAALFERGLGAGSEVVSKEMFRLESRAAGGGDAGSADDSVVLRPENTASMLRALIHAGMHHSLPAHVYYCGPQFRYERPQKGRARQFHQFGVECFGRASPMADVECILSAVESLRGVGLLAKTKLKINTLGESEESRSKYSEALLAHFSGWKRDLSMETQTRIKERRILRVLDSKSPLDAECIASAPSLLDHLPPSDVERFNRVVSMLKDDYYVPNIEIDSRLVRGLDYYSHTCFEFVSMEDNLTVLAGGRYDSLARTLGYTKADLPAIGWAAGLERLFIMNDKKEDDPVDRTGPHLIIVPRLEGNPHADKQVMKETAKLALRARREGLSVRVWDSDKGVAVKRALKEADNAKARYVCFLGQTELVSRTLPLRDVQSGQVKQVGLDSVVSQWD